MPRLSQLHDDLLSADCPYSSDSESSADALTAHAPTKSAHAHARARAWAIIRLRQVHRSAVRRRSLRKSEPLHVCWRVRSWGL